MGTVQFWSMAGWRRAPLLAGTPGSRPAAQSRRPRRRGGDHSGRTNTPTRAQNESCELGVERRVTEGETRVGAESPSRRVGD